MGNRTPDAELLPQVSNDEPDEKSAKKTNLDIDAQRRLKLKADLAAAADVIKDGRESTSPYLGAIIGNVEKQAAELKKLSHDIHDTNLPGNFDGVAAWWDQAKAISKKLKDEIDAARCLIFPGAFAPHTTQWDSAF